MRSYDETCHIPGCASEEGGECTCEAIEQDAFDRQEESLESRWKEREESL